MEDLIQCRFGMNSTNFKLRYTTNPGYADLLVDSMALVVALFNGSKERAYDDFKNIFCPSSVDLVWSIVLALLFTLLRHLFNMMFQVTLVTIKDLFWRL